MTLRTRIVAALVFAALIPMAVVIAAPLVRAGRRAKDDTAHRRTAARVQAGILLDKERAASRAAADRAAEALASSRSDQAALVRARAFPAGR